MRGSWKSASRNDGLPLREGRGAAHLPQASCRGHPKREFVGSREKCSFNYVDAGIGAYASEAWRPVRLSLRLYIDTAVAHDDADRSEGSSFAQSLDTDWAALHASGSGVLAERKQPAAGAALSCLRRCVSAHREYRGQSRARDAICTGNPAN
jgi:hypothetical protein